MARPFRFELLVGNSAFLGQELRDHGVMIDCVVTSPPYRAGTRAGHGRGLRRYGSSAAEIGHEATTDQYVERLAEILTALPVRERGSIWINLDEARDEFGGQRGVPTRLADAMRARGWLLTDRVIWAKNTVSVNGQNVGNRMPESIPGRFNDNAFEDLLRFTRSPQAWIDLNAAGVRRAVPPISPGPRYLPPALMLTHTDVEGTRRANVWQIPVAKSRLKHAAMFPHALVEIPIAATCPQRVCATCGHPRTRVVETVEIEGARRDIRSLGKYQDAGERASCAAALHRRKRSGGGYIATKPVTTWFTDCFHNNYVGGVVCDPFAGTAVTGEVALKMGRSFVGGELYQQSAAIAYKRCRATLEWLDKHGLDPWALAA
jgi:site-specific DNA-methyltransferase (adenine-specific)